jgi:basic membrane protein A
MKKLLAMLFLAVAALVFVSCDKEEAEIALVTDVGTIDDESFNQASWQGVKKYAEEKGKTYRYYQPKKDSNEARLASIRQAVRNGAKIIVCPGYLFIEALGEAQNTYPDVKFVLLDGAPEEIEDNLYCVLFKEEQAGFLAGYAAVMDGYTKLGYLGGMEVPAVQRFGYGYIQGIDYAAKEKDIQVTINFHYGGKFEGTPEITARMETWYKNEGIEVVFACGGGIYTSAVEAAGKVTPNGKVIGVDVDQAHVSELVITSAMKGLEASVYDAIDKFYNNKWDTIGGKSVSLGLEDGPDFVGLPTTDSSWRFQTFTKAQYETLKTKIIDGTIEISDKLEKPTVDPEHTTVKYIS